MPFAAGTRFKAYRVKWNDRPGRSKKADPPRDTTCVPRGGCVGNSRRPVIRDQRSPRKRREARILGPMANTDRPSGLSYRRPDRTPSSGGPPSTRIAASVSHRNGYSGTDSDCWPRSLLPQTEQIVGRRNPPRVEKRDRRQDRTIGKSEIVAWSLRCGRTMRAEGRFESAGRRTTRDARGCDSCDSWLNRPIGKQEDSGSSRSERPAFNRRRRDHSLAAANKPRISVRQVGPSDVGGVWPKAYSHRRLGQRPRTVLSFGQNPGTRFGRRQTAGVEGCDSGTTSPTAARFANKSALPTKSPRGRSAVRTNHDFRGYNVTSVSTSP